MFPFPFSFLSTSETPLAQIDNLNSMSFDGINDSINIPPYTLTENSTVSFW